MTEYVSIIILHYFVLLNYEVQNHLLEKIYVELCLIDYPFYQVLITI